MLAVTLGLGYPLTLLPASNILEEWLNIAAPIGPQSAPSEASAEEGGCAGPLGRRVRPQMSICFLIGN